MLIVDQNFSAPISESAEYRQIRMLAVSELLYRRLGSWSWSNKIQQTGVTDIAAGYGGFWKRTSESIKKTEGCKQTWRRINENHAKDFTPARCCLNEEVCPFALVILGKGRVINWSEHVVCILCAPKAAMIASIVFVFTVLNVCRSNLSLLLLFLPAALLFWLC